MTQETGGPQRKWHIQLGSVIRYFHPMGSERLSVADDDAIKEITTRNPYNFPKPRRVREWMSQILGKSSVLIAEGEDHARQRKALAPAFSTSSIRQLLPIFWEKSLLLTKLWKHQYCIAKGGCANIEVLEWMNGTTLDIICAAALGEDIDSLSHPEHKLREAYRSIFPFDLLSRIVLALLTFSMVLRNLPVEINRKISAARKDISRFAVSIVEARQAEQCFGAQSIVTRIIRAEAKTGSEPGDIELNRDNLRDQIMTFLGAGHGTTATAVAWTLDQLAKHPRAQVKLREEIKRHLPVLFDTQGSRDLLAEARARENMETIIGRLDDLCYLDDVCRESLRFIPPIPTTLRRSRRPAHLGGCFIPGGSLIFVLVNTINRLPEYWGPTADKFDPDRWAYLPTNWPSNAFMSFLAGPRGCIGRRFAETEMKVLLCCLISSFEFVPDPSFKDQESLKMWRLVLRPRDGINLRVRGIKSGT